MRKPGSMSCSQALTNRTLVTYGIIFNLHVPIFFRKDRRERADMALMWKVIHNKMNVDKEKWFKMSKVLKTFSKIVHDAFNDLTRKFFVCQKSYGTTSR